MLADSVMVLGDYFCDFILTGLKEVPRLAADVFGDELEITPGGAFITATALGRLGVNAEWVADLGNDMLSQFVLAEARREGLSEQLFRLHDKRLRKLSFSFSFTHDRGFISYCDPHPTSLPFELVEERRPAWVINPPFDGGAETQRFIAAVHRRGGRVYLDCQYVGGDTLDTPGLAEALRAADIFAPNRSEAQQLTGADSAEEALRRLMEFSPLVVIKCGADGALAGAGRQTWRTPALSVDVVDTTGAGDCFNAGFLAACMRGESIETCLRWGNIGGGLSTTRLGGTAGAPTLAQLQEHLQKGIV